MIKIFFSGLLLSIITSCTTDDKITNPIAYSPKFDVIKNFNYYTYNEYKPKFLVTSLDLSKVGVDPGTNLNSGIFMVTNIKNPAPVDPVVNLGRVLFYDKNLSVNGQVSCGSCHIQSKAFADGLSFSVGHSRINTEKNSMSIQNMAFLNNYQWQSATDDLVQLVAKPLVHPIEMGNRSIGEVVSRIESLGYYDGLHKLAFGNAEIEEKSITWALAQFVGSIYSSNSRFDKSLKSAFADFTQEEMQGKELFFGKALCNQCHSFPTFAAPDFVGGSYGKPTPNVITKSAGINADKKGMANNGLSGLVGDLTRIKIPTLRNIEYTGPYMHDGRFKTLEEVIDHYNHDLVSSPDLDDVLRSRDKNPVKLNLSSDEKKALKAFMITLTDTDLLTAKRYSDPFQ